MDSNKDEALRALSIAQRHRDAGNYPSARRFTLKSISLFETSEAQKLLAIIESEESASSSAAGSGSGAETHPSQEGAKQRHAFKSDSTPSVADSAKGKAPENTKRDYTPDQLATVKRVTSCKVTEYYEILSLKKDCEETQVKKAYRKLALVLHPDKNGAPGADEAFKMVSKAFQVLSDPQKRSAFDASGGDPEDRFGGMRASPGFANGGGGMAFEGELNPEDLFNMFFGGGLNGGFGGGPAVFTTFGPGGFRTVRMDRGGRRQTQGAAQAENAGPRSILMQLLPLIILFGFTLLSSLPSLFETPPTPDPSYSFRPSQRFSVEQLTGDLGIKYHVNPTEMMRHPIIGPELIREGVDLSKNPSSSAKLSSKSKKRTSTPSLRKFEKTVETRYTNQLYGECQREVNRIERAKEREMGIFGIGADWEKIKKLQQDAENLDSCNELKRLGVIR